MTKKEMTELFTVMMLAWPNAEMFKGGVAKLGPTISLWASCTDDVDFFSGQQAVARLCRICKFPPTIAEFREQVKSFHDDLNVTVNNFFDSMRMREWVGEEVDPREYYRRLPAGSYEKTVIDAMGGPDKLVTEAGLWNYSGFRETLIVLMRNKGLPGSTVPMLTDGKEKW